MKSLVDELGFCFIVFQRSVRGDFVKCWIDGSVDYEYYSRADFLQLADKIDNPCGVRSKLEDALSYSSTFLWDIDNSIVRRLSAGRSESTNISANIAQDTRAILNRESSFNNAFKGDYSQSFNFVDQDTKRGQIHIKL